MKAKPTWRRHSEILAVGRSILTTSASITSAEPHFEVMPRLPCLATRTPAPAMVSALAVEMLKVSLALAPGPQVLYSASRSVHLTSRVEFAENSVEAPLIALSIL